MVISAIENNHAYSETLAYIACAQNFLTYLKFPEQDIVKGCNAAMILSNKDSYTAEAKILQKYIDNAYGPYYLQAVSVTNRFCELSNEMSMQEALIKMIHSNIDSALINAFVDFEKKELFDDLMNSIAKTAIQKRAKGDLILFQNAQKTTPFDKILGFNLSTNDVGFLDFATFRLYPGMWYGIDVKSGTLVASSGKEVEHGDKIFLECWEYDRLNNIWGKKMFIDESERRICALDFRLPAIFEKKSYAEYTGHVYDTNNTKMVARYREYLRDFLPNFVLGNGQYASKTALSNDELVNIRADLFSMIHQPKTMKDVSKEMNMEMDMENDQEIYID